MAKSGLSYGPDISSILIAGTMRSSIRSGYEPVETLIGYMGVRLPRRVPNKGLGAAGSGHLSCTEDISSVGIRVAPPNMINGVKQAWSRRP